MLNSNVIPMVHVQRMVPLNFEGECDHICACSENVPFHVQGECDPFGACSENGTGPC